MNRTLAQINATTLPSYYPSMKYFNNIGSLVNLLVPLAILIASLIFLFMIFKAAFTLLTSQGDPEKISSAQSTITYGVIGLVIIMLSFFIVKIIELVLGIDLPL
jgi:hypothetical protein